VDFVLVDAMTQRMVLKPWSLDTILATNLHADILSDLAASLTGGLGIGATANLDPTRSLPSMFEPIHGSALDIVGKGIANPIGALWTACLMLDHLGEFEASKRLMRGIETVTAKREVMPHDLGGGASTHEVTQAIIAAIRNASA
jgi:tartrate dehydrogenase/decarboxylase/D-malate dehydrogenase